LTPALARIDSNMVLLALIAEAKVWNRGIEGKETMEGLSHGKNDSKDRTL
jgi:hypothetical protein